MRALQIVLVERIPFHMALYFVTTTLTTGLLPIKSACPEARTGLLTQQERWSLMVGTVRQKKS